MTALHCKITPFKKTIYLSGSVNIRNINILNDFIIQHYEIIKKWNNIIINLEDFEDCDSSCLQVFLALNKSLKGKVHFTKMHSNLMEAFQLHGFSLK